MNTRAVKADAYLFITAFIWGTAFVAQRLGMEHVGPFTFNGVRFALGCVVLLPLMALNGRAMPKRNAAPEADGPSYPWVGLAAGLLLFGGAALQQVGLKYTTAAKAGFITGLYVIIVPFMGLFFGHKPGKGTWIGTVLAAVGLYFLSINETLTVELGDGLELAGAVFWAGHLVFIGLFSPRMRPLRLAMAQYAACSALSLGTALAVEEITLQGLGLASWAIVYAGVLSVGIAYTLQVVAQRHAKATHAAIILSLEAVFAALAEWAVIGDVMSMREIFGAALMFAGIIAAQLKP